MMTRCTNQQNRNDHFCSRCQRRMRHGESYWRDEQADIVCDDCAEQIKEPMADYYKVVCSREFEMAGAGLGYDEIFGDGPRYFRSRTEANARAAELNNDCSEDLVGTYSVKRRSPGDDENDRCYQEQIGPSKRNYGPTRHGERERDARGQLTDKGMIEFSP